MPPPLSPDEVHVLRTIASGAYLLAESDGSWSLAEPGDDPAATWVRGEHVKRATARRLLETGVVVERAFGGRPVHVLSPAGRDEVRRRGFRESPLPTDETSID